MANIKVKNIYYMLSYAFQTLREAGFENIATEDFDNIYDLFAAILIQGVRAQVKRGLNRDYIEQQEALAGLRGQVNIAQTIKQQTQLQGKLVCAFDEFSRDSPHNQALKSVLLLLMRQKEVKRENQESIHRLLPYFSGVTKVEPTSIRWDALKYHRNNASYRMLLGICRLVVKGLLLTTEAGSQKLDTWIQDEQMSRLYEKFVLSYYVRHHPEFSPTASFINWDVASDTQSPYLPKMKSDVTLQKGHKKLIIDTKYYGHTLQYNSLYDRQIYISGNLYQIYAYVKNSDKGSSGDKQSPGNVAGVLLYAKTDEAVTPDEDIMISGNRIGVKTLDLSQDWSVITAQLETLCEWLNQE